MENDLKSYLILLVTFMANITLLLLGVNGIGNDIYGYLVGPGVYDDLNNLYSYAKTLPDPENAMQYTAFTILYGRLFEHSRIVGTTLIVIIGILMPITLLLCALKEYYKHKQFVILLLILSSYPIIFALFRGNPAIVSFLWVINSLVYYFIGRPGYSYLFLLISTLFHPAPSVFGAIFILSGYKRLLLAVTSIAVVHVILYMSLGQSLVETMSDVKLSLVVYRDGYIYGGGGDLYNNSLYMFIKLLVRGDTAMVAYVLRYIFPAMSILLLVMIYLFYRNRSLEEMVVFTLIYYIPLFLVITSPVSADYRLVYLLVPLVFMFLSGYYGVNMYLLLIIMLPKHFVFYSSYWMGLHPESVLVYPDIIKTIGVTINTIINPVLMMILFVYQDRAVAGIAKEAMRMIMVDVDDQ